MIKPRSNQLVKDFITVDTGVKTDEWKGYLILSRLSSRTTLYTQNIVKYKDHFVDPDGTHTNGIDGMWYVVKNWLRHVRGVHNAVSQDYLNVFLVRIIANYFGKILEWIRDRCIRFIINYDITNMPNNCHYDTNCIYTCCTACITC